MDREAVIDEFRAAGALREGHFVLSSGLHSGVFLQKNLVFMHADRAERLCRALAQLIEAKAGKVDVVISPAVGGIIPGYETARWLKVTALYVERENGRFKLRRGFHTRRGAMLISRPRANHARPRPMTPDDALTAEAPISADAGNENTDWRRFVVLVALSALAMFVFCLVDQDMFADGDTNWHVGDRSLDAGEHGVRADSPTHSRFPPTITAGSRTSGCPRC